MVLHLPDDLFEVSFFITDALEFIGSVETICTVYTLIIGNEFGSGSKTERLFELFDFFIRVGRRKRILSFYGGLR